MFSVAFYYFSFYLGNVYISDSLNHRIRKVTVSTGIISTFAGNGGTISNLGDNGPATSATLNYPQGIAVDSAGTHSSLLLLLSPYLLTFIILNTFSR